MYRELLIGCGRKREKDLRLPTAVEITYREVTYRGAEITHHGAGVRRGTGFQNLTTLDINRAHGPDIVFNLERIDGESHNRIPLHNAVSDFGSKTPDDHYDEIHAYEVLEHIGRQGDYQKFFAQFTEFWRILKPGGLFFASCPSWLSMWAWGDPSHTRVLTPGTLVFLSQKEYERQVGKTAMSDFRFCYKADFDVIFSSDDGETFTFILRAIK